jgi:hypothetical protein
MKLFIIILLSILFSCKNKTNIESIKTKQVSRIDTLAVISFRRSYVDHQYLTKKELDKLYKSNPILEEYDGYKKYVPLFKELEKLKILEEKDLILKRFENIYSKEVKYLDSEKQISFNYSSDFTKSNSINIKIVKNNILIEKKIDFERDHFIGMILKDVDNDGIKEILILLNFYIMNGDNYILMINKFVE